ncbi:ABC-2 type transport system ATP-binding protein [Stackebrandtia albiflava]|uniref:ABC-2 type transport system ATP-binding protein n=1 Tax=Stackebrandtia albiflava TaxID=406432 RepID=A0A562UQN3_9ACTN|nr:ABC transporter ATP-binding protein [Stackebrandtia albiflava]TWJ07921.1 ABC-2 type transport system ATP-binding protein [Stackebrandtia albiflava]
MTTGARRPVSGRRAVRTTGLSKTYGKAPPAVDDLDLEVPEGAVMGFLGPNGSGKTTTIRMLLGLIEPSRGRVELLGEPMPGGAAQVLPKVGALVEGPAFHPYLSGRDNLRRLDAADRSTGRADRDARISLALDRVGLLKAARKTYRAYSLGMKQRLALAAALLRPRDLLVLDEPTNGLDPQGTREVRSLIADLAADGTTVLLSTHLLSEVSQVCSHVAVMHRGGLKAQGALADLAARAGRRVRVDSPEPAAAAGALTALGLAEVVTDGTGATAEPGETPPEKIIASVVTAGVPVVGFRVHAPGLEELFLGLTGEGFDVSG